MATPATASQYFEFSFTFGNAGTLSGRTPDGQNTLGDYLLADASLRWNDAQVHLYDGPVWGGSFDGNEVFSTAVTFNIGGTIEDPLVTWNGGWVFTLVDPWAEGDTHFHFRNASGTDWIRIGTAGWIVDGEEETRPRISNPVTTRYGLSDSDAALVPEINGSGFVSIAFILGALGLWLYSGAGAARDPDAA